MELRDRIRDARKTRGMSQEALARGASVSLSLINQIERGVITDPHYSTLAGIADALGMPIGKLLEEPVLAGKAEAPEAGRPEEEAEGHDAESAWQAAYEALGDEIFARWEDELEEKMALVESDPVAFDVWVQKLRDIGNPYVKNLLSGCTAGPNPSLEDVVEAGGASVGLFVGRWAELWRRIERVTRVSREDERLVEEMAKESARVAKRVGDAAELSRRPG